MRTVIAPMVRHLATLAAVLLIAACTSDAEPPRASGAPSPQPTLIVLSAQSVTLSGNKLVLHDLTPNATLFADRPVRAAGHALVSHLLDEWRAAKAQGFATSPPNATVSALVKSKGEVTSAVMVLRSPRLEGDTLSFDIQLLQGNLAGADGPAAVFIDLVRLPQASDTSRKSAWYSGQP
jgi:hypothetical protein